MITSVTFRNFKVLKDSTLRLGPFTVLIGPNGAGKSTVFEGLLSAGQRGMNREAVVSRGVDEDPKIVLRHAEEGSSGTYTVSWNRAEFQQQRTALPPGFRHGIVGDLAQLRVFDLDPRGSRIRLRCALAPNSCRMAQAWWRFLIVFGMSCLSASKR